ncbi:Surface presentation of antigens protein SpaO [Pandoraea iniqua]|uniref:YscQ/HrcQ family type III secretion apparatus protein n=1 Tax=Pandoraea iniqua TaxID=2508288 RepID=UPI001240DF3E|nr:YscQ/HrcQ family type III secretion apparatus protein [Pandoraea iniqua]VVD64394.1 Surface presentation of antigens protein SpaO [Pandoraea iniqua]
MLRLRRVDEALSRLARADAVWRARGLRTSLEHLPRMGTWICVHDTARTWQAWIEPGMWLEGVSRELASLACCADTERLAARLFASSARPLHLPVPELAYDDLEVGAPIEGSALPEGLMLKVRAQECPVWIAYAPVVDAPRLHDLEGVRFWLDAALGRSRVRAATLRLIERGDVLLIREGYHWLSCGGLTMGSYRLEEGELMLETYTQPETVHETASFESTASAASSLEQLPVDLVFVLQRQRISLAELRQLWQTQVLPLQPGAEQRVEVRVNDALIARGELVELDGRLGVEINEWFGSAAHVE